ncbi:NADH-quinone oxidoreductase subunit E, partial [Dysosmobacter welbionis]
AHRQKSAAISAPPSDFINGVDALQLGDRRQDPDVVVPAGQPNGEHRAGILGPLLPAPVQIHFVNLSALRLDAGNDVPQIVQRLEFHIDVHVPGAFDDGILHEGQQPVGQQDQQEAQKYALVKSRADGQTHTGGRPKARRRGQSLHLLLAGDDDGARTQKAD